jgi:GNAT superfamily N-acetyltransferase
LEIVEQRRGEFVISTDPARLDIDAIHGYLRRSYWAENIPRAVVEKAVAHSLCFSVYAGDQLAGFARVVSDYATFAYICDVFVLEEHRGQGLAKWLLATILAHPELQGLRRWMLVTRDAHGLYQQYGFQPARRPENVMEITHPGMYKET